MKIIVNGRGTEKEIPQERVERPEKFAGFSDQAFDDRSKLLGRLTRVEVTEENSSRTQYAIPRGMVFDFTIKGDDTEILQADRPGFVWKFPSRRVRFITIEETEE